MGLKKINPLLYISIKTSIKTSTFKQSNEIITSFAMIRYHCVGLLLLLIVTMSCVNKKKTEVNASQHSALMYSKNLLDYRVTPNDSLDKTGLMFSDQGAWFAYGLKDTTAILGGFSGPFLLTEQNGIWSSKSLANFQFKDENNTTIIDWKNSLKSQSSTSSYLKQVFQNDTIKITQELIFSSPHTALQKTTITNLSSEGLTVHPSVSGELFDIGITFTEDNDIIKISSANSPAKGYVQFLHEDTSRLVTDQYYNAHFETIYLKPKTPVAYLIAQTFIFPEYSWKQELENLYRSNFDSILQLRCTQKDQQLKQLFLNNHIGFKQEEHHRVLAKAQLTLQNNWRIPAGEIKHQGLFPSYHYVWFNGFWSWDSWKHAVGLSFYDLPLAKDQMRLMFKFQNDNGFVADCVFRDTLIERHNYRDTKPPLSAWAVAEIYKKDEDLSFVEEMYPKIKKYHNWWYEDRDYDKDGLCEFGSTDGSLIAAKWESGMDNAIRFDGSKIIKSKKGAYSLNQESVDLNAYLYAEKLYLAQLADALTLNQEAFLFRQAAEKLQIKIQAQFYDDIDGWFYDTDLDGETFIKGEGSEGWTALWANCASKEQAQAVRDKMMDPSKFYTQVPFQTMSRDHPKFDPLNGYWRGPNWLDQSYFGVKGLRNYGFIEDANKATIQIIKGAEGVMTPGIPIRENYHPITGKGLHAKNFSWSAAHIIMLLSEERN